MPNDAEDRQVIGEFLAEVGIQAESIPESNNKKSCDLRDTEHGHYLIEIKGLHDDDAIAKTPNEGKIYSKTSHFDWANLVDDAIKEAVKQLDSTAGTVEVTLRIIALVIWTTDADLVFKQIMGTIYGKGSLKEGSRHLECLYFSHSAFHKHRAILDGVVVVDPKGATFWLNDYGNHPDAVRESILGRFFAGHDVLNDAPKLERDGFLVADCDLDRNCVDEVLQFVKQKYHLANPRLMDFKRYSAMAR